MPTQPDRDHSIVDESVHDDLDSVESESESESGPSTSTRRFASEDVEEITARVLRSISTPPDGIDFVVEKIEIVLTDPPEYRLHVVGLGLLAINSATLLHRGTFQRRFMEKFRRLPKLPKREKEWEQFVDKWLAESEVISMPPEASEEGRRRELIEAALRNMHPGESLGDLLTKERCLEIDARRAYRLEKIRSLVAKDDPCATPQSIGTILRDMGFEPSQRRIEGQLIRVWLAPTGYVEAMEPTPEEPETENKDSDLDPDTEWEDACEL